MRYQLTSVISALILGPAAAHAATITVPGQAPTIQIAINLAVDGDEIVVAPGTYFESLDLIGKTLTLRSSGGAAVTAIDALGQFDSVIHCTQGEGPETLITGFTLRNGEATGGTNDDRGGAIFVQSASLTVTECTLELNEATYGGAIYGNGASLTASGCTFTGNDADSSGGAIYVNNSDLSVTGCVFQTNEALATIGGAIRTNGGTVAVESSQFTGNTSPDYGGAIALGVNTTSATIGRSSFTLNHSGDGAAAGRGGAISVGTGTFLTLTDSVFMENSAHQYGGALYSTYSMTVRGCTLFGNTAGGGTGGGYSGSSGSVSTLTNLVMWNNGPGPITGPATSVTYCDVEGGHAGTGNIDADPVFVDAVAGDLRLQAGSPCLDAGDTTKLSGAYPTDFDGAMRAVDDPDAPDTGVALLNVAVDMGAFERQPVPAPDPCPDDVDGDGLINVNDLLRVLGSWGVCPG